MRLVPYISIYGNMLALGIHALDVGVVVLFLRADGRGTRGIRSGRAAHQQSGAGTDGRALAIAADRSSGQCPHRRTDCGTGDRRFLGRITSRLTADLVLRVLTTIHVVDTETIKRGTGTRQNHDARPGRHDGTGPQQQSQTGDAPLRETLLCFHFSAPVAAEPSASPLGIP